MAVDVLTETMIHRPLSEVAAYVSDPDNSTQWYKNILRVEWKTEPPLVIGSELAFVAKFLGRELAYTYKVIAFEPEQRLVMSTSEGPFPMETTYTWRAEGENQTHMSLRNKGQPIGFAKVMGPFMVSAMRKANLADLRLLKQILETV